MIHKYNISSTDANQPKIVEALRRYGAVVYITTCVKKFTDIVVAYNGKWYLMEVKDGSKPPSQRKLTPGEKEALRKAESVGCTIHLVTTKEEAIQILKETT